MTMQAALSTSQKLIDFLHASPTAFHAVAALRNKLLAAGATELPEGSTHAWVLEPGKFYFVVRNESSLIAFKVGANQQIGDPDLAFRMAAAHTDSPSYKLKARPTLAGPGNYLRLNVEPYGGMIDQSWFDRPLGLAGRVYVRTTHGAHATLVDLGPDSLIIPSVAPHLTREKGVFAPDKSCDLMPLFSAGALDAAGFTHHLAEAAQAADKDLLSWDLFLYNGVPARVWGAAQEFVSGARLDDLQSAFAAIEALLATEARRGVQVVAAFDNEEVGSLTKQGASSTLLRDTLERVAQALGLNHEAYLTALARSFMASCDNAHAVHPAHPELMDPENQAFLNQGPVLKENAAQHYTTDAFSRALMTEIFRMAEVPFQSFANRSDLRGGSTLGNLSNAQVSVHAADLGLPQLAMHSAYETAGVADTHYAVQALTTLFNADDLHIDGATGFTLTRD